jgi:hypothetical protein
MTTGRPMPCTDIAWHCRICEDWLRSRRERYRVAPSRRGRAGTSPRRSSMFSNVAAVIVRARLSSEQRTDGGRQRSDKTHQTFRVQVAPPAELPDPRAATPLAQLGPNSPPSHPAEIRRAIIQRSESSLPPPGMPPCWAEIMNASISVRGVQVELPRTRGPLEPWSHPRLRRRWRGSERYLCGRGPGCGGQPLSVVVRN